MNQSNHLVIVIGLGADGKPHGAQFDPSNAKLAAKAAKLMGLQFGRAETEPSLEVAKGLPRGKIYASGRAFTPLIKRPLYEQLLQAIAFDPPLPDQPVPEDAPDLEVGDPWARIRVGSVVLYGGKNVEEGWWECVVTKISEDGELVTMVWRGAPKERSIKCRRRELGLMGIEALKALRPV